MNHIRIIASMAAAALVSCASPGAPGADHSAVAIGDRLAEHIRVLSADEMEGRGAGYAGERRAADYIAAQFQAAGLEPAGASYFQNFEFRPAGGAAPFQILSSRNVIGMLRGAQRPEEVIVLGAHYDGQGAIGQASAGRLGEASVGSDRIWNSASDNATSIAALIEIAGRLVNRDEPPARSIIFVAFSAEENRLNGALAYVRQPPVPWERHVAMINLEKLVGHEETELISASAGTSPRFTTIADIASAESGLSVASFYDGIVSDTDHFAFNLAGLPALVIGTGAYEHVHTNSDEYGTLDLAPLQQRVSYVLAFVEALANDDQPLTFTGDMAAFSGIFGGPATEAELSACGIVESAFVITELAARTNAENSGLRVGDVVVSANGAALSFPADGVNFLEDAVTARGDVELEIACGAQRRVVTLPLGAAPK